MARLSQLRPLGQLHDSFIIASGRDGLWIIDQHVAHERILFEKVLRERARGNTESQRLLVPAIITLRPDQAITLTRIDEEFRANGFELEPFGHRTIAVKAAPAGLSPTQVEALLNEILDTPEKELRELSLGDLQSRVAATIACHAAIKINMPLEPAKMQWLLDELARAKCPMSCPHGRPIAPAIRSQGYSQGFSSPLKIVRNRLPRNPLSRPSWFAVPERRFCRRTSPRGDVDETAESLPPRHGSSNRVR